MIFSDYTEESMDNFDAVLKNYGVERTEGIVIEGDSQHYAQMSLLSGTDSQQHRCSSLTF